MSLIACQQIHGGPDTAVITRVVSDKNHLCWVRSPAISGVFRGTGPNGGLNLLIRRRSADA
ncbi:MAG UNVERIFIED_CONTAM: hypothetical protein LVR18_45440 [Planctomycetaceae bacterium]|jgi:hypothetical protein